MGNAFGLFFSGMSALTTFDRTSLRLVQRRFRIALGCTFCLSGKLAEVRSTCHSRKRFLENVSPRFFNAFDRGGGVFFLFMSVSSSAMGSDRCLRMGALQTGCTPTGASRLLPACTVCHLCTNERFSEVAALGATRCQLKSSNRRFLFLFWLRHVRTNAYNYRRPGLTRACRTCQPRSPGKKRKNAKKTKKKHEEAWKTNRNCFANFAALRGKMEIYFIIRKSVFLL